jgi:hypothetical protein
MLASARTAHEERLSDPGIQQVGAHADEDVRSDMVSVVVVVLEHTRRTVLRVDDKSAIGFGVE